MRRRYSIRSATVIIFRPWRSQYGTRSGTRAIVPSSFMISQIDARRDQARQPCEVDRRLGLAGAAEDAAVAGAQREDVAGLDEVGGEESGSIATWIVCARSAAEMPVVTPSRASIETVKAVPRRASLRCVIGGRPSSSQRSSVRQRQIEAARVRRHEVDDLGRRELGGDDEVALVLAVGVVDDDDEPAVADVLDRRLDRGERASSRGSRSRLQPSAEQALDVLREHVDLEVDRVAGRERAERGDGERVRDERDREAVLVEAGDRERDAVDCDRALLDAVAEQPGRSARPRRGGRRPPARRSGRGRARRRGPAGRGRRAARRPGARARR